MSGTANGRMSFTRRLLCVVVTRRRSLSRVRASLLWFSSFSGVRAQSWPLRKSLHHEGPDLNPIGNAWGPSLIYAQV